MRMGMRTCTDEQLDHQFLAKAYDCVVKEKVSGQITMSWKKTNSDKPFVCDSYVVGCLKKYRCTALDMGRGMMAVHSDIPVHLLPMLASGISEKLHISHCTLVCGRNNVNRHNLVKEMQSASPTVCVDLRNVRGTQQLKDCDVKLPNVRELWLGECGEVNIFQLSHTFTQLCELEVVLHSSLVYTNSADFRPLNGMRKLRLWTCGKVKLREWTQLCPHLTDLVEIKCCQMSWDGVTAGSLYQWRSLQVLSLSDCGEVRPCRLRQLCPALKELDIANCEVCADDVSWDGVTAGSLYQWRSLQVLSLSDCGEVRPCRLRQLCPAQKELDIANCEVCADDVDSRWQSLQKLELLSCGEVRLCQWRRFCPELRELEIKNCAVRMDDKVNQCARFTALITISFLRAHLSLAYKWINFISKGTLLSKCLTYRLHLMT